MPVRFDRLSFRPIRSVTLLGSASGRNAGDAALMAAIMQDVDAACGYPVRYEIPSICPRYIRDHYPNSTRPVGMMPWHGALRMLGVPTAASLCRTDGVIIFDAVLFDRALFNPLFNFLSSLYLLLPIATRRGIPVIGYNVGVGPVHTPAGRRMLRAVAERMAFITVRDQDSLDLLQGAGVRNPRVQRTADAALNAPAWDDVRVDAALRALGVSPDAPMLGVNINRYIDTWASPGRQSIGVEAFLSNYAEALNAVVARLRVPLVFVSTQHHDVDISHALMRRLAPGTHAVLVDNRQFDHAAVKGILRRVSLLCGMRLHAIIMASAEHTPVVGLRYQPKVGYYFRELGQEERGLSFDDFSVEALRDLILRGWEDREPLRRALDARIPVLQRRASAPAGLVAALSQGADVFEPAWLRLTDTLASAS